jgi:RNA polymerase sigma factor (sigma-70 family)
MYYILIGTFVSSGLSIIVLTNQSKLFIMKTNLKNPEVSSWNTHDDLIEGCKRGDQKAQFRIYKLYYKAMYNTSLLIVNDSMEAEDIMQESFLSAFEKINTYSGEVSFGAWLKKIVQNRSIDSFRKSRKMTFENIETVSEPVEACSADLFNEGEPDIRFKRITEAVKTLSEGCRQIFSLYFLEGYDHEEISQILTISGNTSRSQLSRAKNSLKSALKIR